MAGGAGASVIKISIAPLARRRGRWVHAGRRRAVSNVVDWQVVTILRQEPPEGPLCGHFHAFLRKASGPGGAALACVGSNGPDRVRPGRVRSHGPAWSLTVVV